MQIVEHSVIGTRSAVIRMRRRDTELQILLFPMLHVASPAFYRNVARRLRACDLLIVEGVKGRSVLGWAITLSYRAMPANRRSGLVEDDIPYLSLGVEVVNPDVTAAEFGRTWRTMPLRHRLAVWAMLPFLVVAQFVGGARALLTPEVEVHDLPGPRDEAFADDDVGEQFERTMGGERDERVLAVLGELIRTRGHERIDVAVVYGAGHMPALVRGLVERHGFRPRTADWLTVVPA